VISAYQWFFLFIDHISLDIEKHGRFEQQTNKVRGIKSVIEGFLKVYTVPSLHPSEYNPLILSQRVLNKLLIGHIGDGLDIFQCNSVNQCALFLFFLIGLFFVKIKRWHFISCLHY
jgi:hypothetical protein